MSPVVPLLQQRPKGIGVEQILQRLVENEKAYGIRTQQMMSVRFYLQRIIWQSTAEWVQESGGATSYATLVDLIRQYQPQNAKVAFITVNYDMMLEQVLTTLMDWEFRSVADYVHEDGWSLFKLHGSVNWGRVVTGVSQPVSSYADPELVNLLIRGASADQLTDSFYVVPQLPGVRKDTLALAPAVAIPVEAKSSFECPSAHITALAQLLPSVSRLMVIGWRAQDQEVLDLLRKEIGHPVRGYVVSGSENGAVETIRRLDAAGVIGEYDASFAGFSQSVTSGELEPILSSAA